MKIIKYLLMILFPMIIVGCSIIFGIKEPTEISKVSVIEYLNKHNITTNNVVFLKDNYIDTLIASSFKPNWEPGFRPIQFKVFNNNGRLISQYSSCEGPLKNILLNDKFPPKNINPIDTSYTLKNEQRLIEDSILINNNADYIAIIYWATYTGFFGRRFVIKTEKYFKYNEKNITIYKLNTDYIINDYR